MCWKGGWQVLKQLFFSFFFFSFLECESGSCMSREEILFTVLGEPSGSVTCHFDFPKNVDDMWYMNTVWKFVCI